MQSCDECGSYKRKTDMEYNSEGAPEKYVVRCGGCGLVLDDIEISPAMDVEDLKDAGERLKWRKDRIVICKKLFKYRRYLEAMETAHGEAFGMALNYLLALFAEEIDFALKNTKCKDVKT